MKTEFEQYLNSAKDEFILAIKEQDWNPELRVKAENFIIAFDQLQASQSKPEAQQGVDYDKILEEQIKCYGNTLAAHQYAYEKYTRLINTPFQSSPSPAISIEEIEDVIRAEFYRTWNPNFKRLATAIYTLLANKSASQEAETMKRNPVSFEQAKQQVERLNQDNLSNPWPLKDVLSKLVEAADILLHKKDYDGHGHEEIFIAVQRAKEIRQQVERLNGGGELSDFLKRMEAKEKICLDRIRALQAEAEPEYSQIQYRSGEAAILNEVIFTLKSFISDKEGESK